MAALVQTIPQQASTITLLQPRPASASGATQLQSQQHHPQYQMARNTQHHRQSYSGVGPITGYRHPPSSTQPVAPYAFTSTPSLANSGNQSPQLRPNSLSQLKADSWSHSSQTDLTPAYPGAVPPRAHYHHAAGSVSTNSSASVTSSAHSFRSKDDSALPSRQVKRERAPRPLSTVDLSLPPISLLTPPAPSSPSAKPSPDRYRRGQRRTEQLANSNAPSASVTVGTVPLSPSATSDAALGEKYPALSLSRPENPELKPSFSQHNRNASADNVPTTEKATPELAKRYRLSIGVARANRFPLKTQGSLNVKVLETPSRSSSLANKQPVTSSQSSKSATTTPRPVEVSQRGTSSPLSKPVVMEADNAKARTEGISRDHPSDQAKFQSPAAKRLSEISKKGGKAGKSRLRRALSFSSVAELRSASSPDNPEMTRKQQLDEELGAEQAAIAQKQEAGGLGENIYSGQRHFFTGSTDNISVSSTASSASIMLRKMGKGVKRSTRSLVGLFRPKSLHNVSLESEPMVPQVSRVTVEAQLESATSAIPSLPREPPAIERNSVDTANSKRSADRDENIRSRKSILGGDKERAEILAAVKKGILKKTMPGGCSPVMRPSDSHFSESPRSSAPTTPRDDRPPGSGHRRTDSVMIDGDEYFLPGGRFSASRANSAPATPQNASRNISFSPRIQFHDTWPSGEYDRRGDIATCNRLTPLLAQQIKEELNTFKMVRLFGFISG
ncbi:predicted protein [Uncinocarpus reesii 1704]|uniref:Bud neck involved protein n=1 Tax=Uncinocarpus reesii (strain UAMH 1704) TaxID=336963 RepID=C4JIR5_UNCRE|nr:uncharacterized protein UREG_02926 [Uncinocarpus reesii 1704]EEP78077.1 predicted protein [Uncinocarpus reesii 1704]